MNKGTFLEIKKLYLYFRSRAGRVQAVDGVNLELKSGRTLVIVGESGCGKSSLARAILRVLPENVDMYKGEIFLDGQDIMKFDEERFRREIRWIKLALVTQAAMNSLNPVMKIVDQIAEVLIVHNVVEKKEDALARVADAFRLVGVPLDFLSRYPFELSGGMQQRAVLSMALITKPELVILDEPTSALDLLTQASIMNMLKKVKMDMGMNFILITHDIASSSELANEIAVMYAGQIVEVSDAGQFYKNPLHPYSEKLMASVPTLHTQKELDFIPGQPPTLIAPPDGCRFAPRCFRRFSACSSEPALIETEDGRYVKCWLYQ